MRPVTNTGIEREESHGIEKYIKGMKVSFSFIPYTRAAWVEKLSRAKVPLFFVEDRVGQHITRGF